MWSCSLFKDILNILWKNRTPAPVPDPAYPANQIVLRSPTSLFRFTPYYTGNMTYYGTDPMGNPFSGTISDANSGQPKNASVMPGTDFIITGSVTQLDVNGYSANVDFVSVSDILQHLDINSSTKTLDMRNGASANGLGYPPYDINVLYARADTNGNNQACVSAINNSPDGGTLWINTSEAYAADVLIAAQNHGWTVYQL